MVEEKGMIENESEKKEVINKKTISNRIKNIFKKCTGYLKANKYFSSLIFVLALVIIALIISLFQMKN